MFCSFKVALAASVVATCQALRASSGAQAYQAFLHEFGVERVHADADSFQKRVDLFEKRLEDVRRHNARSDKSWVAAVNKFADYTEAEFMAMMGHRRGLSSRRLGTVASSSSFLERDVHLSDSVDWSSTLNISNRIPNQGGCGSCWAVSAVGALEAHAKLAGTAVDSLSYEQLVDCTPNPNECGGTGGCKGATAELAFDEVSKHGLALAKDYHGGYQHGDDKECKHSKHPVVTVKAFVRLTENQMQPLLEAVSRGPVVVSADASPWSMYSSGVFDGCKKDAIINHAILMVGYGKDEELNKDYWLIRNSWGPGWGEKGFIRLLRHTEENAYCGIDDQPLLGVGCKGGPATLPVCGMCGILSDSVYPTGVHVSAKGIF